MGEIAEMMLSGVLCQVCGVFLGEETGYPVTCEDCDSEEEQDFKIECCCECDHFPAGADSTHCPMIKKKVKRLTNAKNCEFAE